MVHCAYAGISKTLETEDDSIDASQPFEVTTEADSNDMTDNAHDSMQSVSSESNKQCRKKERLTDHSKLHSGKTSVSCTQCEKFQSRERKFECSVCSKRFRSRYHLVRHSSSHCGEKPYKCYLCDKVFGHSEHVNRHKLHTGKPWFSCTQCEKPQSREKKFECSVCSKRFRSRYHLVRHSSSHSGEKPYKCYLCDKVFGHSEHLNTHMRIHTGKKLYQCNVNSVSVNTEADNATECPHDDLPSTGKFGISRVGSSFRQQA